MLVVDGDLTITTSALRWTANQKGAAPDVVIPLSTIKNYVRVVLNVSRGPSAQLANKSAKVILKVVQNAHGNNPETDHSFTFVSKTSASADRERVKEALAVAVARNRQAADNGGAGSPAIRGGPQAANDPEMRLRQSLLSKNKELSALYKELVATNVVSEEDFWETRKHLLESQSLQSSQKKGTPNSMLAQVKPEASEGSDLKYTLTQDIIDSIFIQFPSVHRAYQENVPGKVSMKDFWTKYFSSKYFHKPRQPNQAIEVDELFRKYVEDDDDDFSPIPKKLRANPTNQLVDLSSTSQDNIGFEYGNRPDQTMRAGGEKQALPLIRSYNRHSTVVLRATQNDNSLTAENYQEETRLEDLELAKAQEQTVVNIKNPAWYYEAQKDKSANVVLGPAEKEALCKEFALTLTSWDPKLPNVNIDKAEADAVIRKLGKLGAKRKRAGKQPAAVALSIHQAHAASCEHLRHYWTLKQTRNADAEKVRKNLESVQKCKEWVGKVIADAVGNERDFTKAFLQNIYDALTRATRIGAR
ncbi:RNA polymerase II transcription factor B subunit 1 [Irineochytrium annulatum]|nr:RNA polymerase II transcription factor B subunit 1 [Irineochytrium annulatum]